jgi:uncharacterized protein (TIGR00255 family)
MLRSMTGFGAGSVESAERIVSVEARSVNHRYLDVRVHVPSELMRLLSPVEAAVKRSIARGRVDVAVQIAPAKGKEAMLEVDLAKAEAYRAAYVHLAEALSLSSDVRLDTIAAAPGVFRTTDLVTEVSFDELAPALMSALGALSAMRDREGRALEVELRDHLKLVKQKTSRIAELIPSVALDRKAKLEKRLQELLGEQQLDPMRLAQEVALLADRADVTEELERLVSHTAQFELLLASDEPIGRRLDFLIQEMNRETNTIGSKCSNTEVAYVVVDIKAELERMREQVQNVE